MGVKVKRRKDGVAVVVGVLVGVAVSVGKGVDVGVSVDVGEGPKVGVWVGALVAVGVAVDINWVSMTSCGAVPLLSRLARLKAVLLVVVSAKLMSPFPLMSGVISTEVHAPAPNAPDDPYTLPTAGELVKLTENSPHELSLTLRTW